MDNNAEVREAWDARARAHGTAPSGVLFKGLSEDANAALHQWHVRLLSERFLPAVRGGGKVADLGCGYGRLAQEMVAMRPDVQVVAQDLSLEYCRRARSGGFDVVQSSVSALPFGPASFAGAIAVTSLMYVERPRIPNVLAGIREVLEGGAPLLLVDPGLEAQRVGAMLTLKMRAPAVGRGFGSTEYLRLARAAGFKLVASGGNPQASIAIAASAGGRIAWKALRSLAMPRSSAGRYSRLALHRWLLLEAPHQ